MTVPGLTVALALTEKLVVLTTAVLVGLVMATATAEGGAGAKAAVDCARRLDPVLVQVFVTVPAVNTSRVPPAPTSCRPEAPFHRRVRPAVVEVKALAAPPDPLLTTSTSHAPAVSVVITFVNVVPLVAPLATDTASGAELLTPNRDTAPHSIPFTTLVAKVTVMVPAPTAGAGKYHISTELVGTTPGIWFARLPVTLVKAWAPNVTLVANGSELRSAATPTTSMRSGPESPTVCDQTTVVAVPAVPALAASKVISAEAFSVVRATMARLAIIFFMRLRFWFCCWPNLPFLWAERRQIRWTTLAWELF